jgi:hypothetical protein
MASGRGQRPAYIALRVKREPLDQTNLRNGVDATLGGGVGIFWNRDDSGAHRGPGGTMVGRPAPPGSLSGSSSGGCLL